MSSTPAPEAKMNPLLKIAVDVGPLAVFFLVNANYKIFAATAAFMVCIVIALAVSYIFTRKLAVLPLVTCVFVLVFGGLTLWLQDELFIKLKPTIVNTLFAGILFGGLAFKRLFLKNLFSEVINLTQEGWHKLTVRWALFFLVLAVLNEIVWRNYSTDTWVSFKVFGIMPLTMIFALSQIGILNRYQDNAGEQK